MNDADKRLAATQRQAALAGGLSGQVFAIPGLAVTLNLVPDFSTPPREYLEISEKQRLADQYWHAVEKASKRKIPARRSRAD